MAQYPFPADLPRVASPAETAEFLRNLMSMTQLREASSAPPTRPAASPAPQGLGGLVGLARSTGRGIENNQAPASGGFGVLGAGTPTGASVPARAPAGVARPAPQVIWNKDRTQWRYAASNAWHPASEQP